MSRSTKKAAPRKDAPRELTLLEKGGVYFLIAVAICVGLYAFQAVAEESDPDAPVIMEVQETPVEAEETDEDGVRARFGRAFDYVFKGETEQILEVEAEDLRTLQASLAEKQDDLTALEEDLLAEAEALDQRSRTVDQQVELYEEQLQSLHLCISSALAGSDE